MQDKRKLPRVKTLDPRPYNRRIGEKNGRAKLTKIQIAEIRAKRARGVKLRELRAEYGVCEGHLSRICRRPEHAGRSRCAWKHSW